MHFGVVACAKADGPSHAIPLANNLVPGSNGTLLSIRFPVGNKKLWWCGVAYAFDF